MEVIMADKGMTFQVRKGGRKIIGQAADDRQATANDEERGKDDEPKKPVRGGALDKK